MIILKPNYVPGLGNPNAKLMIVGEAPGKNENTEKQPFVGITGQDVNQFLKDAGSSRNEVWLTNVSKYQPPYNNWSRLSEVANYDEQVKELWREIEAIKPNCILALGENALQAVSGKRGIRFYRGSILTALDGHTKVVATYHPAYLYKQSDASAQKQVSYQWKYIIGFDFERAVVESKTVTLDLPNRDLRVIRSSGELYRYLDSHLSLGPVSVDIEAINCIPVCIGLSFTPNSAISIPLFAKLGSLRLDGVGESELVYMWRSIDEALRTKFGVIGQNFKYDEDKIYRLGFRISKLYGDTLLLGHTLNPEYPSKKLEFFTSIYTREPYYKEEGKEFSLKRDKIDRLLLYNARDAAVTLEVHQKMEEELADYSKDFNCDFTGFYHTFVAKLQRFYLGIEQNGFLVDTKAREALLAKYTGLWEERQDKLEQRIEQPINCSSPKQISELIYEKMKLPFHKGKGKKSHEDDEEDTQGSTGEAVIAQLMQSQKCSGSQKMVLQDILDIRKIRKTIGTYILPKADYDGFIKTNYNIVGTETGRTSTGVIKGPPVRPTKMGLAFQTLTKHGEIGPDIRTQFIPPYPDWCFIEIDQSQAEDRVVTLFCGDLRGLDEFKTIDKHWQVASWIFADVKEEWALKACNDPEKPDKSDGRRFIGKKGRHGSNYDMGADECSVQITKEAQKFGLNLRVSKWRAGEILQTVHERKPEIRSVYHASIKEAINRDRTLIGPSLYGVSGARRRQFTDRMTEKLYKEAYAYLPQCTVADQTKGAGLRISERVDKAQIKFLIESHDAFIITCPTRDAQQIGAIMKEEFERPINFRTCVPFVRDYDLVIPAELEIGEKNLKEMVKLSV